MTKSSATCPPGAECMVQLARIETICKGNKERLEIISGQLEGNGAVGLKVRIDRLEQTSKRRDWWYGAAVLALFAVGGTVAVWFLTNRPPAG